MSGRPEPSHEERMRQALRAIQKLQARVEQAEQQATQPIAVVGLSCRVPGASDPIAFWRLLRDGVDAIGPIPVDRWDVEAYFDANPDAGGRMYARAGGFIDGVDRFDPQFFGISPREARSIDPQHRLLLEVVWEALEQAGEVPAGLANTRTGVFVGITQSEYGQIVKQADALDAYHLTGSCPNFVAGRVSHLLGLQGPAMAIDTACSSSLVAVHLASQSLRLGDCDLALAGGVNLILLPDVFVTTSKARMLAPDGRCKTFDARADGFGRGEGCGVLVLRRLRDAEARGDRILGVIRGSAVNQDGPSSGLTVPNKLAQEAVIRDALAMARLSPDAVDYVEAHGTGTSLGDPIEVRALAAALGAERRRPFLLGSVKTNIGHLEAAAGVAGLVKVLLALGHGTIPPHLHLHQPNPHIDWKDVPARIPTDPTPWPAGERRRVAGVSSFGASGTNAHVIVEEAPKRVGTPRSEDRPAHVLTLSARTRPALVAYAASVADFLASETPDIADACLTFNTGRTLFAHRLAVVAADVREAHERLAAFARTGAAPGAVAGQAGETPSKVAFLFTGQGAQYAGMARGLYDREPVFRAEMDRADALLRDRFGWSLLSVVNAEAADAERLLDRTQYTQPALFAVELALAALWKTWGVQPAAVMGHSVGEYAAACAAGVLGFEDGLTLVAERGRLMAALPEGGAMAAIFAGERDVVDAIAPFPTVSIAGLNAADNTVIAGPGADVQAVVDTFAARRIGSRRLAVSHAFHSALLDPMLDEFERAAARVPFSPPALPLLSNLTGGVAGDEVCSASYWRRHARQPVRFAASIQTLRAMGICVFLEIGPDPALIAMAKRAAGDGAVTWVPSLRKGQDDFRQMLSAAAALHVNGIPIDWQAISGGAGQRLIAPTYPFQRERCWIEPAGADATRVAAQPAGLLPQPLRGLPVRSAFTTGDVFEYRLTRERPSFAGDHRVGGTPVFPAMGVLAIALDAAAQLAPAAGRRVEDLSIFEALPLSDVASVVQLRAVRDGANVALEMSALRDAGRPGEPWVPYASARLVPAADDAGLATPLDLAGVRSRCAAEGSVGDHYAELAARGMEFGPSFRGVRSIRRRDGEALIEVELPEPARHDVQDYALHPCLLDACAQGLWQAIPRAVIEQAPDAVFLPISCRAATLRPSAQPITRALAHVVMADRTSADAATACGDIRVYDDQGSELAALEGVVLRRASSEAVATSRLRDVLYQVEWQREEAGAPPAEPPSARPGTWLIFADEKGIGARCASRLAADGARTVVAHAGAVPAGAGDAVLDPVSGDFRAFVAAHAPLAGVLHLWNLDTEDGTPAGDAAFDRAREVGCGSVLRLAQALLTSGASLPPVWVVTRGAQAAGGGVAAPLQAASLGAMRTIALEHPELACYAIDLDPDGPVTVGSLIDSLRPGAEHEVAIRGEHRYLRRLARLPDVPTASPAAVRLENTTPGVLGGLRLLPLQRSSPARGQVEIAIRASGVNFRDVLNALGMYPGDAGPLGNECAGIVTALGDDVRGIEVGDEVMAAASGSMGTRVVVPAHLVVRKPANLSFTEAAATPIAFLTAEYALRNCGGLSKGQAVLIHAAAGGVGLAAIQIAQAAGAEIFATAGSEEKRHYLADLGVRHVFSSRTPDFGDRIRALTNGRGVDVVLNSLTGDFIPESLAILAAGGRFVEIGKKGIWTAGQVAAVRPDVTYTVVYLGDVFERDAGLSQRLLRALADAIERGALRPLPTKCFPLDRAEDAFRFMAQAKHIGKIALVPDPVATPASDGTLRPDRSYIVTGGLGALGLHVARELVAAGARRLVLVGRSAPSERAAAAIADLEAAGASVTVEAADVSERDAVARVLQVASNAGPIGGVVHAAAVVRDATVLQQDAGRLREVFAAKAAGACHLHDLTRDLPLDFFVLFSSSASILGSAGQSNYAAANALLDALAHYRTRLGLRATAINWGPWAQGGMASALGEHDRDRFAALGWRTVTPAEGRRALRRLMHASVPQVAVLPLDWRAFVRQFRPGTPPQFAQLVTAEPGVEAAPAPTAALLAGELAALPPSRRRDAVVEHVRKAVAVVLGLPLDHVLDASQGLRDVGLDSLMAVELRNRLQSTVEEPLSATLAFDYPTVDAIAGYLSDLLGVAPHDRAAEGAGACGPEMPAAGGLDGIGTLTEAEAEALLEAELSDLEQADRRR